VYTLTRLQFHKVSRVQIFTSYRHRIHSLLEIYESDRVTSRLEFIIGG